MPAESPKHVSAVGKLGFGQQPKGTVTLLLWTDRKCPECPHQLIVRRRNDIDTEICDADVGGCGYSKQLP